jgi:hypothetical protein
MRCLDATKHPIPAPVLFIFIYLKYLDCLGRFSQPSQPNGACSSHCFAIFQLREAHGIVGLPDMLHEVSHARGNLASVRSRPTTEVRRPWGLMGNMQMANATQRDLGERAEPIT